jgi:hypothetical protein
MQDLRMDGAQKAPTWFWVALVLLVIGAIIAYIVL